MNKTVLLFFLLAFTAFAQKNTVAILPSESSDASFSTADLDALTDRMREIALEALPSAKYTLLTQNAIVQRLGGSESYIKKCSESSCIVDLGKKAKVDYVVQAGVGLLKDKMWVNVEVYNVGTGALIGKYNSDGFTDYFALVAVAVNNNLPYILRKIPDASAKAAPATTGGASAGMLADARDGKEYKTVKIGKQIWMAENLNYEAGVSTCYDRKLENCTRYGRFYDWATALKVCLQGWHLPANKDWEILVEHIGGVMEAGDKLRAASGWMNNGTDNFGFSALPGGKNDGNVYANFQNGGKNGFWWSAAGGNSDWVKIVEIRSNSSNVYQYSQPKHLMLSVRCVKD